MNDFLSHPQRCKDDKDVPGRDEFSMLRRIVEFGNFGSDNHPTPTLARLLVLCSTKPVNNADDHM